MSTWKELHPPPGGAAAAVTAVGTSAKEGEEKATTFTSFPLSEALRCVGDRLLDASLFGLDIADCARLAAVSRDVNATVAANPCWRKALCALEHDFRSYLSR
jgi:hypothetical protein